MKINYKKIYRNETPFLQRKILASVIYPEFFPINNTERVVNLGSGLGPQMVVYANNFASMVGVDVNAGRLQKSEEIAKTYGIKNFSTICSDVVKAPLPYNSFDKALAIDIIEHTNSPVEFCLEINRLLKDNGQLLITFPVLWDKYVRWFKKIGKVCFWRKKLAKREVLEPDRHHHEHSLKKWIALVESCGFKYKKHRATSLVPPFYHYGLSPFWLGENIFSSIDSFFSQLPILKNLGVDALCVFEKKREVVK